MSRSMPTTKLPMTRVTMKKPQSRMAWHWRLGRQTQKIPFVTKRLNSWGKACHHTLHNRMPIDMSYRVSGKTSESFIWPKIELNRRLRHDGAHKQIMTTKRRLEYDVNSSADEAMRYTFKKRNIPYKTSLELWATMNWDQMLLLMILMMMMTMTLMKMMMARSESLFQGLRTYEHLKGTPV